MRQKIVAGNWKMNKTLTEAQSLTSEIANMVEDEGPADVKVVIAPPFPFYICGTKFNSCNGQNCFGRAELPSGRCRSFQQVKFQLLC